MTPVTNIPVAHPAAGGPPLTVAWFSFYPVEWMPDAPEEVRRLPKLHPASWQRVLLDELATDSSLQVHVIVLRKQFARDLTFVRRGITFHLIKVPGGLRAPSLFWLDTFSVRRVLKQIKPDVVHAWGTEQGAGLVANRLGYPRVITIQGLISWYEKIVPYPWVVRLAGFFERLTLARAVLVTTEAKFTFNWLQEHYPKTRVLQIEHAPDPVFHGVARTPQVGTFRFLFVGALDFRKGGDVLLQALDQLKAEIPFELIVVGQLKDDIAALISRVSPELWPRVQYQHNLTPAQIAAELSRTTMAICASRADVSPNAVKEAVVAGVPVIGTNVGGIPDYVHPGRNGVLCAADNVAALVEAIRTACAHPLFRLGKVDPQMLEETRAYLSPKTMAQKFRAAYFLALEQTRKGT
jgi:glycosyltransferase involved in cell wall biosynthesis